MKKILFVDDEPHILNAINRGLHSSINTWELFFASSGYEALELLKTISVDIIVSDFQMPNMDGLELLSYVEDIAPHTIRVMLTGQPDKIQYSNTINICHHFFCKPLQLAGFKRFLQRIIESDSFLDHPVLTKKLCSLTAFPIPPQSYHKLTTNLNNPDLTPKQLSYLASKDIALTMELFKLSSSANFTREQEFKNLEEAITSLGIENIRALIATQYILREGDQNTFKKFELDKLQNHSFEVMRIAEALAVLCQRTELIPDVMLASLLHDAGHLILAYAFPDEYLSTVDMQTEKQVSISCAEQQILSANHAQVGAYLACLWGIPSHVIPAIRQHSLPQAVPLDNDPVSHLVWHANRLAQGIFDQSINYYEQLNRDAKWAPYLRASHSKRSGYTMLG